MKAAQQQQQQLPKTTCWVCMGKRMGGGEAWMSLSFMLCSTETPAALATQYFCSVTHISCRQRQSTETSTHTHTHTHTPTERERGRELESLPEVSRVN